MPSPAVLTGKVTDTTSVTFGLPDPDQRLRGVRLWQEVRIPGDRLDFTRDDHGLEWRLDLDLPDVGRMEYLFELTHHNGATETIPDPSNPLRAHGVFGDKSVLELPGYAPPTWLATSAPAGSRRRVDVLCRELDDQVTGELWAPDGVAEDQELPLLVVHDGPEMDQLASLTAYLAAMTRSGELPPMRAALLAPGPRNERYSANGPYTRALCLAVLPRLRQEVATTATIGMGASLGALAMLHVQRQPESGLDALFLQSGSFFHPRHDAHERRFPKYEQVVRSVAAILRAEGHPSPVPTVMTCGAIEENLANNRIMARALAAQGYDVALHEVRDVHNYTAWRDAFHPCLTRLLREVARAGS